MSVNTLIFLVIVILMVEINGWDYKDTPTTCYKCAADGNIGPCADPFNLYGRPHFKESCKSGWCLKVETGAVGKHAHDAGVGYVLR